MEKSKIQNPKSKIELVEAKIIPENKLKKLMAETNEITAMIVSSIKTIRNRKNNPKSKIQNPK